MSDDSKITTDLDVDDPLQQDADFLFDADDRRYIDNQVRGIQKHMVAGQIRGVYATWFRLSGSSAAVAAGDCVLPAAINNATEPTVTRGVTAAFAAVPAAAGVVLRAATPGSMVLVATAGELSPLITGLGAAKGRVRVNGTTARCERVDALGANDIGVGSVDTSGWLQVSTALGAGGGGLAATSLAFSEVDFARGRGSVWLTGSDFTFAICFVASIPGVKVSGLRYFYDVTDATTRSLKLSLIDVTGNAFVESVTVPNVAPGTTGTVNFASAHTLTPFRCYGIGGHSADSGGATPFDNVHVGGGPSQYVNAGSSLAQLWRADGGVFLPYVGSAFGGAIQYASGDTAALTSSDHLYNRIVPLEPIFSA